MSGIAGRNVARLREALGLTQQELAEGATNLGARLDRSAVSRIESGERSIGLTELAVLALVLQTPAVEMLRTTAQVPPFGGPATLYQTWTGLARHHWPEFTPPTYAVRSERQREVANIARERAVRRAAAQLGQEVGFVARACWELWRHGLTEERDQRAAAIDPQGRSERALRAMVTPQLLADLRHWFETEWPDYPEGRNDE